MFFYPLLQAVEGEGGPVAAVVVPRVEMEYSVTNPGSDGHIFFSAHLIGPSINDVILGEEEGGGSPKSDPK